MHHLAMSHSDPAQQVLDALKLAEQKPAAEALPLLNALIPLVQGGGEQSLEAQEARASAFLSICEVGKALHRGQPTHGLYAAAITATERWIAVVG
jgi:hypothetical protein